MFDLSLYPQTQQCLLSRRQCHGDPEGGCLWAFVTGLTGGSSHWVGPWSLPSVGTGLIPKEELFTSQVKHLKHLNLDWILGPCFPSGSEEWWGYFLPPFSTAQQRWEDFQGHAAWQLSPASNLFLHLLPWPLSLGAGSGVPFQRAGPHRPWNSMLPPSLGIRNSHPGKWSQAGLRKHHYWIKLVDVMELQLSYFKSWKRMLWKRCTQYASKFGKLSSGHRTGKGQFSFQSLRKAIPKNAQTTAQLHSSHTLVK